jgi:hypothetical protein
MNRSASLSLSAAALAFLAMSFLSGCKKNKEPIVIEEVAPQASAETDSTGTLAEEPDLRKVGEKSHSAKAHKAEGSSPAVAHINSHEGFSEDGRYVVQVAVFQEKSKAAALVKKLAGKGFPAYVASVENPSADMTGTCHRVRVGKFATISEAKAFGEHTLKPMGYDYWVDSKKNDHMGSGGSMSMEPAEPVHTAPKHVYHAPVSEPMSHPAEEMHHDVIAPPTPAEPEAVSAAPTAAPRPSNHIAEPSEPADKS